jgi:hypothetical protein
VAGSDRTPAMPVNGIFSTGGESVGCFGLEILVDVFAAYFFVDFSSYCGRSLCEKR